jgi:hypothetical protein
MRSSSGAVTYSDTHRKKIELDVQELARILAHEGVPGGGHSWTPKKLQRVFMERTGRPGSWNHYEVPFIDFLTLFPKTFEVFCNREQVRLHRNGKCTVLDTGEDALIRLGKAREHGFVQTLHEVTGSTLLQPHGTALTNSGKPAWDEAMPMVLPEMQKHRVKAALTLFQDAEQTRGPDAFHTW